MAVGGLIWGAILGIPGGPPGIIGGAAAGYVGGSAYAQLTTNNASNFLSAASTVATGRADYLNGNYVQIGNLSIPSGPNTIESFASTWAGILSPDATLDLAISYFQFVIYDNPH